MSDLLNTKRIEDSVRLLLSGDITYEQFRLVFQPQYDLAGDIIAAEALIRWRHPSLGNILPSVFIPLLEANQKIIELDTFVLEQTLSIVTNLREKFNQFPKIAINISARSFACNNFIDSIYGKLQFERNIILELTESVQTDGLERMDNIFNLFYQRGIEVHLDDFGSGYSSIVYLLSLRQGTLKIDRSFIQSIDLSSRKRQIVKAIVNLANSCSLDVLAEGIETREEFRTIVGLGISKFQGYYFSKPLELCEFESLLANHERKMKSVA